MANEKKPVERKVVSAKSGEPKTSPTIKSGAANTKATGFRILAVALWLVAIAFEVLAILVLNGTLYLTDNMMVPLIVFIVLDLIFVVAGSMVWKHANRIDPASEKNKVKFFLWNNMGLIAAIIAFLPLIVLLLKNDDLDAKTKKIVTVIASIALILAGALSYDWDPVSQEDLELAQSTFSDSVYWTQFGKVYHIDLDCGHIKNSTTIFEGTVEDAYEAHRTRPCNTCSVPYLTAQQ